MSKIYDLPTIDLNNRPNILLVGNGLSRSFDTDSWEKLIKDSMLLYKCPYKYDEIKDVPANMQIVISTRNHVDSEMSHIQKRLTLQISSDQRSFLNRLLDTEICDILTTNYDYSIEQAMGCEFGIKHFQNCRRWTKEVKSSEKRTNLFQYSLVGQGAESKRIWHIHGDICYRDSMVMGHYYYGKLLYKIQSHLSKAIPTMKASISRGLPYRATSWVDLFLMGDVHILGLGMYLTETDLWWLLEFKNRNFPETKVYYYKPKGEMDRNIKMMLELYDNIKIVDDLIIKNKDYNDYYIRAMSMINASCISGEEI